MILANKISSRWYYGWVMVWLSGIIFFFSAPGQTYSISVFIDTAPAGLIQSQTLVSGVYSVATILSGISLIWMGRVVDRIGQRKLILWVVLIFGIVLFLNSFVTSFWVFGMSFFFLRFLGQGSMTLIPNSLVPQWFEKQRATALSYAQWGGLLSTLLVPFLNVYMIQTFSWGTAWRVWSLLLLLIVLPIIYLTMVNKPEDIHQLIEDKTYQNDGVIKEAMALTKRLSLTVQEAIKTPAFWILGLVSTIPSMISTGLTFHFYSLMRLRFIPESQAALIIGLVAFPAFFMPLFARQVVDKYPARTVLLGTLMGVIISLGIMIGLVSNVPSAIFFILFYGVMIGLMQLSLNVAWPHFFGRYYLGSIRGAATVFMVLGSALGPLPFGISYDLTGGYTAVLVGMIIYVLFVLLFTFKLKAPSQEA